MAGRHGIKWVSNARSNHDEFRAREDRGRTPCGTGTGGNFVTLINARADGIVFEHDVDRHRPISSFQEGGSGIALYIATATRVASRALEWGQRGRPYRRGVPLFRCELKVPY